MREFIDPYSNEDTELKLLNSKGMDGKYHIKPVKNDTISKF